MDEWQRLLGDEPRLAKWPDDFTDDDVDEEDTSVREVRNGDGTITIIYGDPDNLETWQ